MPSTYHLRNNVRASEPHRFSARRGLKSSSSLLALALCALGSHRLSYRLSRHLSH